VDVEQIDINKTPPDRAFLEKHVDAARFLDFVSTRSPVFKDRPVLVNASKVTFGFDKGEYSKLS